MLLGLMVLVTPLDTGPGFKNRQCELRDAFPKVHVRTNKRNCPNVVQ